MARPGRLLPLVCIFLAVLAWPVRADDGEKAAETFNALFGADLARVRKTGDARDDAALAARLLETAKKATDQVAFLALVCETVANLGLAHPDGYAAAAQAMELLAAHIPEKAAACRERLIKIRQKQFDAARGDERRAAGEAFLDCLLPVIEAKEKAGDLAEAAALYRRAKAVATAIESPRAAEVKQRAAALAQKMKMAGKIKDVEALLARDPQNVSAREGLVRIYLVELDDPAEAVKHLKGCQDKALLKYVPAAAKGVEAAPEFACLELGEWYRGLAEKAPKDAKAAMYARAKAYLERFLSLHESPDLDRTRGQVVLGKVEEALAKLEAEASATARPPKPAKPTETTGGIAGGVIRPGRWVDLLPLVDPTKDTVRGAWQRKAAGLVIDQPSAWTCIKVPVVTEDSYELEVRFVRTSGDESLGVFLPVGTSRVLLELSVLKGKAGGLQKINDQGLPDNETAVTPCVLENGRQYSLHVRTLVHGRKAAVSVTLDGKPWTSWEGSPSALSVFHDWGMPQPNTFGFSAWCVGVSFRSAQLRMLSGRARLLRTGQAGQGSGQPATPGLPIRPGRWLNLFPAINPQRDFHQGTCSHKANGLWLFSKAGGGVTIPITATGSYQAEFAWKRTWGPGQVSFFLPVGQHRASLVLGGVAGAFSGLGKINGKPAKNNETTVRPGKFKYKTLYHVAIRVKLRGEAASIEVLLDGKPYIDWSGPQSALSAGDEGTPRGCFGLALWGAGVLFEEGRLKMLDGEARLLRPVQK